MLRAARRRTNAIVLEQFVKLNFTKHLSVTVDFCFHALEPAKNSFGILCHLEEMIAFVAKLPKGGEHCLEGQLESLTPF